MRTKFGRALTGALFAATAAGCAGRAEPGAARPETGVGAALSVANLRKHLYIFADDSMMGRQAGTEWNLKATAYLAAEAAKLGLKPAGDNGTYFQAVPLVRPGVDERGTTLSVDGTALTLWSDYAPYSMLGTARSIDGAAVVYGGAPNEVSSLRPEQVAGKVVVFAMPAGALGGRLPRIATTGALADAAAVAMIALDDLPAPVRAGLRQSGSPTLDRGATPARPATLLISRRAAERLFGAPVESLKPGAAGRTVSGKLAFKAEPAPARNVVAILPGSDPALRGQYVAIGAHSDHVGFRQGAVDHDSLRAFNAQAEAMQERLKRRLTPEERASIRVNVDSLRKIRPARRDSIFNGADDDGSGSVSVLAIAQAFSAAKVKPKRSLLFVWHTGEELGLLGSDWYTEHPTVARDSIVAQLNMDMVGRGAADDLPGGGPTYLQLVGSRRLSTELGDLVETVNKERKVPFTFDYTFDANGHPENIYCRSDHYMYARFGIPIVFFTTGLHRDYHQLTDEPQYIDYPHMANVSQLVHDVALRVANQAHRPVVDQPKPDPKGRCQQ
jgi:hypothetical protein